LVDFDGDGRLDLISGSNSGDSDAFHLFRRNKDGSWAPRQRLEVTDKAHTLCDSSFVTAADWNGDGVPDLLIRHGLGNGILVALGPLKENERIDLCREIDFTPKGYVNDFAIADWDRDGRPDLLVRQWFLDEGKGGIYWYKNLGGAGLPRLAEGKLLVEITSDMQVQGFCVCDWNGDGWPDLMVTRDVFIPATPDGKQDRRGTVWLYLRE
jgi:hypothetical protein